MSESTDQRARDVARELDTLAWEAEQLVLKAGVPKEHVDGASLALLTHTLCRQIAIKLIHEEGGDVETEVRQVQRMIDEAVRLYVVAEQRGVKL